MSVFAQTTWNLPGLHNLANRLENSKNCKPTLSGSRRRVFLSITFIMYASFCFTPQNEDHEGSPTNRLTVSHQPSSVDGSSSSAEAKVSWRNRKRRFHLLISFMLNLPTYIYVMLCGLYCIVFMLYNVRKCIPHIICVMLIRQTTDLDIQIDLTCEAAEEKDSHFVVFNKIKNCTRNCNSDYYKRHNISNRNFLSNEGIKKTY